MSRGSIPCPRCGRFFGPVGVLDHMRDLHGISRRDAGNLVAAMPPRPAPLQEDDDGGMVETFRAMSQATKEHRAAMLEQADTEGWEQLTEWHYRRWFDETRIDWWPSGGKAQVFLRGSGKPPRMVYGHRRVAELVRELKWSQGLAHG